MLVRRMEMAYGAACAGGDSRLTADFTAKLHRVTLSCDATPNAPDTSSAASLKFVLSMLRRTGHGSGAAGPRMRKAAPDMKTQLETLTTMKPSEQLYAETLTVSSAERMVANSRVENV